MEEMWVQKDYIICGLTSVQHLQLCCQRQHPDLRRPAAFQKGGQLCAYRCSVVFVA